MHSKVRHLKEIYPDILEVALFTGKDISGTSFQSSMSQQPITSESPSGLSLNSSSSQVTSERTGNSQEEMPRSSILLETPHVLDTIRKFALGEPKPSKGPLTPTITLDILHTLVRSENLYVMLPLFMSQLLIRTGITWHYISDR